MINILYSVLSSPYTYGVLFVLVCIGWFLFAQGCKAEFILLDLQVVELTKDKDYYEGQFNRALAQIEKLKTGDTYYKDKYEESLKSLSLRDDLLKAQKQKYKSFENNIRFELSNTTDKATAENLKTFLEYLN